MDGTRGGIVRRGGPALIRWKHKSGGWAKALARLVVPAPPGRPVIVLSELAGNPDAVGLVSDFAGAVPAALAALDQRIDPVSVRWLAHHGEFSSDDAAGAPETFSEVKVRFDGSRYESGLTDQRLLSAAESEALSRFLGLDPVPVALSALNHPA
jgi:hypothetical protein